MSRPTKCRRVCHYPEALEFSTHGEAMCDPVILTVDEYETIRLIDKEGLSQEECGIQLEVGRTTAQKIYETARKKIADALVSGYPLRIEGGQFYLCNGDTDSCYKKTCTKRQHKEDSIRDKGADTLRIAVTYKNGIVFSHFGRTEFFKIYDIENNNVKDSYIITTDGQGHGALSGFLKSKDVDILICGGIGIGAQNALAAVKIKLYGGVTGNADEAVQAFLSSTIKYIPDICCSHHKHDDKNSSCESQNCED